MSRMNPPENFEFSKPLLWPEWKQRFERYRTATKLNKEANEIQISTLIYSMGKEAEHIYRSFAVEDDVKEVYETVLRRFDAYFVPKRNVIHERARFHQRRQNAGETVEAFIRSLYELAENCDFGDSRDEQIRDRIVIGLLDKDLSLSLQMKAGLDLHLATEMARQAELVKTQSVERELSKSMHIDEVQRGRNFRRGNWNKRQTSNNTQHQQRCSRCNRKHAKESQCPARGKKCRRCDGVGHFAVVCRTKIMQRRAVGEVLESQPEDNVQEWGKTFFLGSVRSANSNNEHWQVEVKLNGKSISFKIDTGADITVISEATYNSLSQRPPLKPTTAVLCSPGGTIKCVGEFIANLSYRATDYSVRIFVVRGQNVNCLLGREISCKLGLVKRVYEVTDHNVFGDIGLLNCEPVKIVLKDNAKPYSITTPRRIPFPLMPLVEAELKRMKDLGIIEDVTEPTEWCAPIVPVPKKNGEVRICVDLKKLNEAVKRERFIMPSLDDIVPFLHGATVFSKLDAASGFWQIPLQEESSKLTTFITPFGRFCFRRLPFGISSAPEIFQRLMTDLLRGKPGTKVIMDDILVWGKSVEEHDMHLKNVLDAVQQSGLKLNKLKCEFRREEIEFFGHRVSKDGIKPDPDKVKAIVELSPPSNVSELRRLLGMINYLGKFLPDLSSALQPLNDLLKAEVIWAWGPEQDKAFEMVKQLVSTAPVLAFYDAKRRTVISSDASSYGMGGVLLQEDDDKSLRPVAFCSRTLTQSEKNYAQIEKECLAAVWVCEKFYRYLSGLHVFELRTDHKPLVPLINQQTLDKVPIRCQRLLMRLRRFNVNAVYIPGKDLVLADALSRSPLSINDGSVDDLEDEVQVYVNTVELSRPASKDKIQLIKEETQQDQQLQIVVKLVLQGWPKYQAQVPECAKNYFPYRAELSYVDGKLIYRNQIVIPTVMRDEILGKIHDGHLGVTKCLQRASSSVWWPGISKEIKEVIAKCGFCQVHRPSQRREPLKPSPLPERPWQKVGVDAFELDGKKYIVVIDYFSRYPEIAYVPDLTTSTVIAKLKNILARWGIPEILISDNGPPFFSEEFKCFSKKYGFVHITSSPYFAQANGEAESGVKIAKRILKQEDPCLALMVYRATPIAATGVSPSQLIMGRQIRTTIPTLSRNLLPGWPDLSVVREADEKMKSSYSNAYNRRHGVRPLSNLKPGQTVRVKHDGQEMWSSVAVIKDYGSTPRSYILETPEGKTLRRNRRHLQATPAAISNPNSVSSNEELTNGSVDQGSSNAIPKSPIRCSSRGRVIRKPKRYIEEC